jgi:hypothetical protein
MKRIMLSGFAGAVGLIALAASAPASAAVTTVFCNAFPGNANPPGNGTQACGTQFKTNSPIAVDNGNNANSIVDTSNTNLPDREGMYAGNIAANAAGTAAVRSITGNNNLVLLDSDEIAAIHGTLILTTTQPQTNGTQADAGSWTYTPLAGDLFQPTVLAIKADGGTTVWSVPLMQNAGVFSGLWSTEGIVNNQGCPANCRGNANFHGLSHGNIYGTLVPLPAAAWMFLTAIAGLFGWRKYGSASGCAATAA